MSTFVKTEDYQKFILEYLHSSENEFKEKVFKST